MAHHCTPMMSDTPRESLLLQEVAALREINQAQQAQIAALTARIEQITQHNVVLRLKVDAMARKLFGRSSEKLDPAQLQMVFDALQDPLQEQDAAKKPDASDCAPDASEAEAAAAPPAPGGKRKKRTLDELVAGLPVTEVLIDPEEVKADPEAWTCIGAEETKLIDYTPGRFQCQKLVRRKYVRKEARHLPPITAPLHTLQDRCIATPRLLAHTAASHFELHLPYYRIAQMYARLGMPIERQTLGGWMGMAHEASGLIIEQIKREVFADGYVQGDETPVKYQDPHATACAAPATCGCATTRCATSALFVWRTSRATASLESIMPQDFKGIIQCDGYQAYETFASSPARKGRIQLAGCLAHMRRKFFEAQAEGADPQWVLAQVQQLYQIEARLREARAGPDEVLSTRQEHSATIMERLKVRLEELQRSRKHLPQA